MSGRDRCGGEASAGQASAGVSFTLPTGFLEDDTEYTLQIEYSIGGLTTTSLDEAYILADGLPFRSRLVIATEWQMIQEKPDDPRV